MSVASTAMRWSSFAMPPAVYDSVYSSWWQEAQDFFPSLVKSEGWLAGILTAVRSAGRVGG